MKTPTLITTLVALLTLGTAAMAQDQQNYEPPDTLPTDPIALAALKERDARAEVARAEAESLWNNGDFVGAARAGEPILTSCVYPTDRVMMARIYSRLGKPDDVIRVLNPGLHPTHKHIMNIDQDAEPRMLYVLALLDKHEWKQAVALYEPTIDSRSHWKRYPYPEIQAVPILHFNPDQPDYGALYAQAHLILAVVQAFPGAGQWVQWQLYQLHQAVTYKPGLSLAHYYAGLHMLELKRNAEAHTEFETAARTASPSELTEIKATLKDLNAREALQRDIEARKAAEKSTP